MMAMSAESANTGSARYRAELGVLEASVARAGLALACCYSSADEYEAEIIRIRRAAGAFRRGIAPLPALLGVAGGLGILALVILSL